MASKKRRHFVKYLGLLSVVLYASNAAHAEQPFLCKGAPVATQAFFRESDGGLLTREYVGPVIGGPVYKFTGSGAPTFSILSLCGLSRFGKYQKPLSATAGLPFEQTFSLAFPIVVGTTATSILRNDAGAVVSGEEWTVTREVPPTEVQAGLLDVPGRVMEITKSVEGKPDEVLWWSVTFRSLIRWQAENGYTNLITFKAAPTTGTVSGPASDIDGEAGGSLEAPSQ